MSPAMVIDGKTHGRVKSSDVANLINATRKPEGAA
jgi:NADH:ubiquinone oxidoreductase subunit E